MTATVGILVLRPAYRVVRPNAGGAGILRHLPAPSYFITVTAALLQTGRTKILLTAFLAIALIAVADRAIGNIASLGVLYMFPMVIAAAVVRPAQIVALAFICAALRSWFDVPAAPLEIFLRNLFAFVAYAGSGLFVIALMRSRAAAVEHLGSLRLEQGLRREAEEQLEILIESSPAAIFTLDGAGIVLGANKAAGSLLMLPNGTSLKGQSVERYLPVLKDALLFELGPAGLRTSAQCQGFRDNGEIFLANLWFSSWNVNGAKRLAAIVVDSSEEMRDREEESLRELLRANHIAAAAVSHEVRNLCGAISVVAANLNKAHPAADADLTALNSLVAGLEAIASMELQSRAADPLNEVSLQSVLDDLRIVLEPQWREIGGSLHWQLHEVVPSVMADRHGLLQVFLNLARNSLRAVSDREVRELSISVRVEEDRAVLRFRDSGPGVPFPERLFEPFQRGSDGTGLGLYVSRAVVRSYGGDLRWEAGADSSCFALELQASGL